MTDVEGDLDYWLRFCAISDSVDVGSGPDDLSLRPGCHLVFGGDSVDKGRADLGFLRSLLALKDRHPDRVHLLLGNRDINKMRLPAELCAAHWLPAHEHPGVYWRRDASTGEPLRPSAYPPRADGTITRFGFLGA